MFLTLLYIIPPANMDLLWQKNFLNSQKMFLCISPLIAAVNWGVFLKLEVLFLKLLSSISFCLGSSRCL